MACLWGCSTGRPAQPTEGRKYAGKTLAVLLPDAESAFLREQGAFASTLRASFPAEDSVRLESILAREFGDAFWSGFSASIDFVSPVRVPDTVPPAPEDRRARFPAPDAAPGRAFAETVPDSAWLAEHGVSADLVLVVGPLEAYEEQEPIHAFEIGGTITIRRIILTGGYLLVDYARNRALAQGRFHTRTEYRRTATGRDWVKAFDASMRAVGDALPFRGPRWYR
jgi:hypothetical protein